MIEPSLPARVARVLVVEDDATVRRAMVRILTSNGYEATGVADGRLAIELLGRESFDVLVSDVNMPRMTGLQLLSAIRQSDLELPVILVTGTPDAASASEARRLGAVNYLTKPVDTERILTAVARAERLGRFAVAKRRSMQAVGSLRPLAGDLAGLMVSLDQALETLFMVYQPIVRAVDRVTYGHEALMRSTAAGLPHPGAILDAAERLKRLPEIGRRVRALAPLPCLGSGEGGVLFINLQASDLMDDTLLDPTSSLANMAHRVVLEITERATLDEVTTPELRVAALREMGYRIAVDDLGAGYAGLTSFVVLEPEVVKLDMSLVRGVDTSGIKQKLIRSLARTCLDMGIEVVAEGIETAAERDTLIELGCTLLQGYLFARPAKPFPEVSWPELR